MTRARGYGRPSPSSSVNWDAFEISVRHAREPLLGDGLFISDGLVWRERRRAVAPVTHTSRLAELAPAMSEAAAERAAAWEALPPGAPVDRLRFAVCGCNNYEQGWFTAFRRIAEEQFDFVFHTGDYIYEGRASGGRTPRYRPSPRSHCRRRAGRRHAAQSTLRQVQEDGIDRYRRGKAVTAVSSQLSVPSSRRFVPLRCCGLPRVRFELITGNWKLTAQEPS